MSSEPVPNDIVRLSKLTFRYRKILWIFGVPGVAVGLLSVDRSPVFGILAILVSVAICVLAASRRSPRRDPAIRLLLEHPGDIGGIVVNDAPGMSQIVFCGEQGFLAFLEIEDTNKFREALDVITVHLPGVPVEYAPYDGARVAHRSLLQAFLDRF